MARFPQLFDQRADLDEGGLQRLEVGQLAADVHGHALHIQARQLARGGIAGERAIVRNAELILRLAG
jgi:hypothetical protein